LLGVVMLSTFEYEYSACDCLHVHKYAHIHTSLSGSDVIAFSNFLRSKLKNIDLGQYLAFIVS